MKAAGRLFYLPIEAYKSRYTEFLSVEGGVFETLAKGYGVNVIPIRPWTDVREIKIGAVLDAQERAYWGFTQTLTLIDLMNKDEMTAEDVIYIEDFWHPGFEMLPYFQHVKFGGTRIPMFAFSHAQSTDPYDFTHPMKHWMRDMERGWTRALDGIFCADKAMISQFAKGNLSINGMQAVGQPFHGKLIKSRFPVRKYTNRSNTVVYSSRLDNEKNPGLFFDLVERVMKERTDVVFCVCSGRRLTKDMANVEDLVKLKTRFPNHVQILDELSRGQYYQTLQNAKVQFNCASQDFVSYTLLEATLHGCAPLYPRWLTFPNALNNSEKNLYEPGDMVTAKEKLYALFEEEQDNYDWVYLKHQTTVARMLYAMGLVKQEPPKLDALNNMAVESIKEYFKCT